MIITHTVCQTIYDAGVCCDNVYIDVASPSGYHVLLQWEMSGTVLAASLLRFTQGSVSKPTRLVHLNIQTDCLLWMWYNL